MFSNAPVLSVVVLVLFAAVATAAVVARYSLVRRVRSVAMEAEDIATRRLPEVLDALRNPSPGAVLGALPQVSFDSDDEIGTIADAFNTVLQASVETSVEHSRRRAETLTNVLVSLGRRNQALIDRQLELVDHLEAVQQDPVILEGLFALDHMLTTMRRNAENLLVLASDAPARRWTQPVDILDVLRGAVSEVADMSRIVIEVPPDDPTVVTGRAAVDLSHLIAELVDNAATYSAPTDEVVIRGEVRPHGYRIWVMDHGFGMSDDELLSVNTKLAEGADIDDLVADRVGFQVVGRLAYRLGAMVRLQVNPGGGLAASISIPAANLERHDDDEPATHRHASVLPAAPKPISVAAVAPPLAPPVAAPFSPVMVPLVAAPPAATAPAMSTATFLVPAPVALPATPMPATPMPAAPLDLPFESFAVPADVPAEMRTSHRNVFYRVELAGIDTVAEVGTGPAPMSAFSDAPPVLERRSPGAVLGTVGPDQGFEGGVFRRLPTPGPSSASGGDDQSPSALAA